MYATQQSTHQQQQQQACESYATSSTGNTTASAAPTAYYILTNTYHDIPTPNTFSPVPNSGPTALLSTPTNATYAAYMTPTTGSNSPVTATGPYDPPYAQYQYIYASPAYPVLQIPSQQQQQSSPLQAPTYLAQTHVESTPVMTSYDYSQNKENSQKRGNYYRNSSNGKRSQKPYTNGKQQQQQQQPCYKSSRRTVLGNYNYTNSEQAPAQMYYNSSNSSQEQQQQSYLYETTNENNYAPATIHIPYAGEYAASTAAASPAPTMYSATTTTANTTTPVAPYADYYQMDSSNDCYSNYGYQGGDSSLYDNPASSTTSSPCYDDDEKLACKICRGKKKCFCYFIKVGYHKFPSYVDYAEYQFKQWKSSMVKVKGRNV